MKNELQLLIELQKIDNQFRDVEISKGTLPQELERMQSEESELSSTRTQTEERLKELEVELRKREKRDEELRVKVEKLQERLFSTQTNQEYTAVTDEIAYHEDSKSENDAAMQSALELQESLETRLAESEERAKELVESLIRMREQVTEHGSATATRVEELDGRRSKVVSKLPKPLLAHYDRIRMAKDGRGVVSVYRGTSCGGCFQTLPPQKINQVRRMADLVLCEICGRILISDLLEEDL